MLVLRLSDMSYDRKQMKASRMASSLYAEVLLFFQDVFAYSEQLAKYLIKSIRLLCSLVGLKHDIFFHRGRFRPFFTKQNAESHLTRAQHRPATPGLLGP